MERLEGKQCILAALAAHVRKFEVILVKFNAHSNNTADVVHIAQERGIPIKIVTAEEIDAIAKGKTHGGLVAICTSKPAASETQLLQASRKTSPPPFFLLLEGVEDEQNLGFIIRSAAAMGVDAIMLKKHIWNYDPLMVSRVSAGAYEIMPMVKIERDGSILSQLKKCGLKIWGALPNAKKTLYDMDFRSPLVIALGGEKRGLSALVREHCDGFFSIPMRSQIASISLSHAAAIIMAEATRQRRKPLQWQPSEELLEEEKCEEDYE